MPADSHAVARCCSLLRRRIDADSVLSAVRHRSRRWPLRALVRIGLHRVIAAPCHWIPNSGSCFCANFVPSLRCFPALRVVTKTPSAAQRARVSALLSPFSLLLLPASSFAWLRWPASVSGLPTHLCLPLADPSLIRGAVFRAGCSLPGGCVCDGDRIDL